MKPWLCREVIARPLSSVERARRNTKIVRARKRGAAVAVIAQEHGLADTTIRNICLQADRRRVRRSPSICGIDHWLYREVFAQLGAGIPAEQIAARFHGVTLAEVVAVRDAPVVHGKSVFPDAGHDQTQGA